MEQLNLDGELFLKVLKLCRAIHEDALGVGFSRGFAEGVEAEHLRVNPNATDEHLSDVARSHACSPPR